MLIDFHAHIFPDSVAARAIAALKDGMLKLHGTVYPTYADGTVQGLLNLMDKEGVDKSAVMPIATKPKQVSHINEFVNSIKSERIIPFGAVHPMCENPEEILDSIVDMGFSGIKLHPEFQDFYVDCAESVRILKLAAERKLIVLYHAGEDVGYPPPIKCTPERLRRLIDNVPDAKVVAAHMGGMNLWEDVYKYLIDVPIWFDTAYVQMWMKPDEMRDLSRAKGVERILFASDSPWSRPRSDSLAFIETAGFTDTEIELIAHQNAEKLLNTGR